MSPAYEEDIKLSYQQDYSREYLRSAAEYWLGRAEGAVSVRLMFDADAAYRIAHSLLLMSRN